MWKIVSVSPSSADLVLTTSRLSRYYTDMHQHNTRRIGSGKIRQLKLSIQIQECI